MLTIQLRHTRLLALGVLAALLFCVLSPALRIQAAPSYQVTLSTLPDTLVSRDDSTLVLAVRDAAGNPVSGALVRVYVQRDQSGHVHADHNTKSTSSWSAPIDAQAMNQPGTYQVKTVFPQSGKWFMRATVETAEGLIESAFVLRVGAASGTGDTNLGWIELGIVLLTLLVTAILTIWYDESRKRQLSPVVPGR